MKRRKNHEKKFKQMRQPRNLMMIPNKQVLKKTNKQQVNSVAQRALHKVQNQDKKKSFLVTREQINKIS